MGALEALSCPSKKTLNGTSQNAPAANLVGNRAVRVPRRRSPERRVYRNTDIRFIDLVRGAETAVPLRWSEDLPVWRGTGVPSTPLSPYGERERGVEVPPSPNKRGRKDF